MHKLISWIAVIIWAALIFMLSHQPVDQSRQLSVRTTEIVIETIQRLDADQGYQVSDLHTIVRKYAHVLMFGVLGILLLHSLRIGKKLQLSDLLIALVGCTVFASLDEWHQHFVPGRGAQISDVLIDTAGATMGIILYSILMLIMTNIQKR